MLFGWVITTQYAPLFQIGNHIRNKQYAVLSTGILANYSAILSIIAYVPIIGMDLAPKKVYFESARPLSR